LSEPDSKALLVILDGLGIAEDQTVSAVDRADTSFLNSLYESCPHSRLSASGPDVGLPEGQFGNSEVGHLNIGSGRIVWQELSRINKDIRDGGFMQNEALTRAFSAAAKRGKIHLMGLFSDGGVHSHNEHLFSLMEMAKEYNLDHVWVHAFTDGRDTAPTAGLDYYREFSRRASELGTGEMASVIGRYFAMDRDNRWERTEKAYRLLVHGEGELSDDPEAIFTDSYEQDVTDEFLLPHRVNTTADSRIEEGDVVIFYNIRGDRARQITRALLSLDDVPFETPPLNLHYTTFTAYDETFSSHLEVAYPPVTLDNTLGEWVSKQGLKQLRIAETEKYPHVTYFFNGGEEAPDEGEQRILVPSPKVSTYDLQPEMSAAEVASRLCEQIEKESFNLGVVNFANPDMVGHTGDMDAAIKAVEAVDRELKRVAEAAGEHGYKILVIADHGNADRMIKPDGSPHTAHTTAPVPAILIGTDATDMKDGILADVAPTLLRMLGLSAPPEMTGSPLY